MNRSPIVIFLTAFFAQWLAGPAMAGLVTVGTNNAVAPNSFPFGFPSYSGEYQQIYTSSAFSGPVTINSVAFATSSVSTGITETVGFTLSLSTTPMSNLTAPSTNYAANRGPDFTQVFSGTETFTAKGDGSFDFAINIAPFTYDPSQGALLMDVNITGFTTSTFVGFEATKDSTTQRIYNAGGVPTIGTPRDATGLVTQFNVNSLAVPEPASLALLGLGLAGTGLIVRFCHWNRS